MRCVLRRPHVSAAESRGSRRPNSQSNSQRKSPCTSSPVQSFSSASAAIARPVFPRDHSHRRNQDITAVHACSVRWQAVNSLALFALPHCSKWQGLRRLPRPLGCRWQCATFSQSAKGVCIYSTARCNSEPGRWADRRADGRLVSTSRMHDRATNGLGESI